MLSRERAAPRAAAGAAADPRSRAPALVDLVVVDAGSWRPVAGAEIEAFDGDATAHGSCRTDTRGLATLWAILPDRRAGAAARVGVRVRTPDGHAYSGRLQVPDHDASATITLAIHP